MEDDKFIAFVEEEANKIGKVFILDSGEGNETYDEEKQLDVEDLSGWLIDKDQQELFIQARKEEEEYEQFDENYIFARWKRDHEERLMIQFQKY